RKNRPAIRDGPSGPSDVHGGGEPAAVVEAPAIRDGPSGPSDVAGVGFADLHVVAPAIRDGPSGPSDFHPPTTERSGYVHPQSGTDLVVRRTRPVAGMFVAGYGAPQSGTDLVVRRTRETLTSS